ncbi:MAG TPA: zinc ribbon domain-containing protein, partial [Kiritimatiellia bacterium]|nr:zinc ribbon domain-containing protein [Kiritimatiellia bacterium]
MPTYEYQCRKCGHEFEKFQSITAAPVKTCPKCRGRVARLVSGGAGIIFKGTGFYQTDYKNAKSPSTSATS